MSDTLFDCEPGNGSHVHHDHDRSAGQRGSNRRVKKFLCRAEDDGRTVERLTAVPSTGLYAPPTVVLDVEGGHKAVLEGQLDNGSGGPAPKNPGQAR